MAEFALEPGRFAQPRREDRVSGRSRKLSLDRYLRLVTRGLPKRARWDTAAELRVHLLERIRALEGQGFPRAEAEHVAVSEMGLPEGTNRAFLGHFFTYRMGWAVLGLVVLGAAVWWGRDNLFAKEATLSSIPMGTAELSSILSPEMRNMAQYQAFKLVMPAGAVGLELSVYKDGVTGTPLFVDTARAGQKTLEGKVLSNNFRHEFSAVLAFDAAGKQCGGLPAVNGVINTNNRVTGIVSSGLGLTCYRPKDAYGISTSSGSISSQPLKLNHWTSVWVLTLLPDLQDCFHFNKKDNNPDCTTRQTLHKEIQVLPQKHWDRYDVIAVRAVDAQNQLKNCVQHGRLSMSASTTTASWFQVGFEPPKPCKK